MPSKSKDKKPKEDRKYNWNMVVYEEAQCWNDLQDRLREETSENWAMIKHDKDYFTKEDEEKNPEYKAGSPKRPHYHVCLQLVNACTFNAIKKKYPGAHIEEMLYKKSSYEYLIHKNNPEKAQYLLEEIISNNLNDVKFLIEEHKSYEPFDEGLYLEYILDGTTSRYRFVERFGLIQYNRFWRGYSDMIMESRIDTEMKQRLEEMQQERERNNIIDTLNAEGLPWETEREEKN